MYPFYFITCHSVDYFLEQNQFTPYSFFLKKIYICVHNWNLLKSNIKTTSTGIIKSHCDLHRLLVDLSGQLNTYIDHTFVKHKQTYSPRDNT